jgi:uncharacterized Tic20 family protein
MNIRSVLVTAALLSGMATAVLPVTPVAAIDVFKNCTSSNAEQCGLVKEDKLNYQGTNTIWNAVRTALIILGGVAVIMIVIGGIKFATSAGDSNKVTSAKQTILYSVIGLVVAMLATVIITLVSDYFG